MTDDDAAARQRSRPSGVLSAGACALAVLFGGNAGAAEPALQIELNKVEDNSGSCVASFVVRNELGQTLDRFSLDLYVFDRDDVIARQVLLDLAPLRDDKTTVAKFALFQGACESIGKVLLNNIPSCRSEADGANLDCLSALAVSSRSRIPLVK